MPIAVRSRRQRWLVDGAASFLVYLIPLAGGHSVFFTGEYLVAVTARRAGYAATWAASDWAAVLVAQAALLLVLRVARRGPPVLHVLAAIGTLVGLTVVLNGLLLVAIPLRSLAESSTAPELNTLTEVCY